MKNVLAIVLKGYPRLSETFIAQEIRGLEKAGLSIRLYSMRFPTDKARHPVHDEIIAPVSYLPEYLYQEPLRVLRGWLKARRMPGYKNALSAFLRDFKREPTSNRGRRFGQAVVLAAELGDDVGHLHAHFLHTPASVTRYAAMIRDMGWTASGHAKDIWTSPDWDLAEKLNDANWTVTCTASGHKHLQSLTIDPDAVHLSYHGLDLVRFPPPPTAHSSRDGSDSGDPVRIISVGRAVNKKGYDILLQALASLPEGLHWRFTHIGGGELLKDLRTQAEELSITGRIEFLGAKAQSEVLAQYRQSDLFVLPCRINADGDRDGLPNVLVEAASQRLTCLSTAISGIPEFFTSGENGVLVEPEQPDQLAKELQDLMIDPERREMLGIAAEKRVREHFDHQASIDLLMELFATVGIKPDSRNA